MKVSRRSFITGAFAAAGAAALGAVGVKPLPVEAKVAPKPKPSSWKQFLQKVCATTPRTIEGGFLVPDEFAKAIARCEEWHFLKGAAHVINLPLPAMSAYPAARLEQQVYRPFRVPSEFFEPSERRPHGGDVR